MNLLLFTLLVSSLATQAICKPVKGTDIHKNRDLHHLESIGIPFPHLVRHIEENFPHHDPIGETKTDPTTNMTLVRYDIPDDIWHSAVESFPHEKRQANILRRSVELLAEGTQGPADKIKRFAPNGYLERRSCNKAARATNMTNEAFNKAGEFFCINFDDELKVLLEGSGPPPPSNRVTGPWRIGGDNRYRLVDVYVNWSASPSFPLVFILTKCFAAFHNLNDCVRPGQTAGGLSGFLSKQFEGEASWSVTPAPSFLKSPFDL